jgi:hypothetical protein
MSQPAADVVLHRLYERYRVASRFGTAPRVDLSAVDRLLEARVVLYEHLVRTGWDPPAPVRRQLDIDALLLEQPPCALPG